MSTQESLKTLLLIDTETTGLDPTKDRLIEVAAVLWSIEHRSIVSCWSELIVTDDNPVYSVNRISPALTTLGYNTKTVISRLEKYAVRASLLIAHKASFDRGFLLANDFDSSVPWVCSKDDIEWPLSAVGTGLVHTALAHGVAVTHAHRSLTDCLTLAYLFERVADKYDIVAMLERAMRVRKMYRALVKYKDRGLAKEHGFSWDADRRWWVRRLLPEQIDGLPFAIKEIEG